MVAPHSSHIGVAISPLGICASEVSANGTNNHWQAPLAPFSGEGTQWASLNAAFLELARNSGHERGTFSVILMPPLAEVRALDLPPLKAAELRTIVARNAQRYFVGGRGPQLIATGSHRRRGTTEPTIAAAVSARLVGAIQAAAREAGWIVDSIAPAQTAWAAAAMHIWPAFRRQASAVLVIDQNRTELLQLRDGHLESVRRFRAGYVDAERIASVVKELQADRGRTAASRIGVIGLPEERKELTRALSAFGITVSAPGGNRAGQIDDVFAFAAEHAAEAQDLSIQSDEVRLGRAMRAKRIAVGLAAASVVLLVLAGAVELWGVRRQIRDVQAQRAAIRPQLSTTLVGRTSIETAYRQLATLNVAARTAPQWTSLLVDVSRHLNDDAYLTSFRGRGDSVIVEGNAVQAGRVFSDLERTPGLSAVHAAAPVRREAPNGGDPVQRFTIAALVGGPVAPMKASK